MSTVMASLLATEPVPETVVNYIVEAHRPGGSVWVTMTNAGDDEALARTGYQTFLDSKRAMGSSLAYRLVRRTAVITDEVLEITKGDDHDAPQD